jgi:hypothetical protein
MAEEVKVKSETMSEPASLLAIFHEPGRVFESFAIRPRFLMAWIVVIVCVTGVNYLLVEKIGLESILRQRIESSSRTADMSAEQKEEIVAMQNGPFVRTLTHLSPPIAIIVIFSLGGVFYWFGVNAAGGKTGFLGGLSVWVYSSLPPTLVLSIANIAVILAKPAVDLDIESFESGLVALNLGAFLGDGASAPLKALLGSIDLFSMWGWWLAAIGLQRVGKVSSFAAWGIVMILALTGITVKVVWALF